jgi:hypothetical protein
MAEEIPEGFTSEEWHELRQIEAAVLGLRNQNSRMYQRLTALGADVNLGPARVQHFLEFLVHIGLVNEKDALTEMKNWELVFRSELQKMLEQATEMRRRQGMAVQNESGIIIPGKNQRG